jgi:hypothetical protein
LNIRWFPGLLKGTPVKVKVLVPIIIRRGQEDSEWVNYNVIFHNPELIDRHKNLTRNQEYIYFSSWEYDLIK